MRNRSAAPPREPAPSAPPAADAGRAGDRTRTRILDTAETLFAERGFAGVSIRNVADAANVNLAAVNYHFGGKERLFEAMFARRAVPINEERLSLLRHARDASGGVLSMEVVVRAFVTPPLRQLDAPSGGARVIAMMHFLSRAFSMPGEREFLSRYYGAVRQEFIAALQNCLPDLPLEDVLWRYNFMVGALMFAMGGRRRMTRLPEDMANVVIPPPQRESDAAIEELTAFLLGGFASPSAMPEVGRD
ncbi:MAG: TetR/AcrR family transcriptional regulator [Alphaproteobacteria bacterium]